MGTKEGRFYIGVGAIIEHIPTSKILLLRRSSDVEFAADIWDDVGGRMRDFETPEEALRREIFEETGLQKIIIIKPVDVSHYYRGEKKAENQMIVITYWCKTTKFDINLSFEHVEHKWVFPEEALTLVTDTNLINNIRRFIEEKERRII
ncbi:MAG: NUDIX domain-containing protein [Candidatus Hodarchaeales archaeon]|jgi:8-oxo-dGTP diphosphatase